MGDNGGQGLDRTPDTWIIRFCIVLNAFGTFRRLSMTANDRQYADHSCQGNLRRSLGASLRTRRRNQSRQLIFIDATLSHHAAQLVRFSPAGDQQHMRRRALQCRLKRVLIALPLCRDQDDACLGRVVCQAKTEPVGMKLGYGAGSKCS